MLLAASTTHKKHLGFYFMSTTVSSLLGYRIATFFFIKTFIYTYFTLFVVSRLGALVKSNNTYVLGWVKNNYHRYRLSNCREFGSLLSLFSHRHETCCSLLSCFLSTTRVELLYIYHNGPTCARPSSPKKAASFLERVYHLFVCVASTRRRAIKNGPPPDPIL